MENLNSDEQIIGLYDVEKEEERIRQPQILGAKREDKKEKIIEIAKNMLKENIDSDMIVRITTLSIEEIESLR